MGFGESVKIVKDYAKKFSNIHYHPAVKPDETIQYTCGADVGVHFIKNTCLNHYFCLPNKIWEYLNASLPVIVSNMLEMEKVVDKLQNEGIRYLTVLFHDRYFSDSFKAWKNWYIWFINWCSKNGFEFISYRKAIQELKNIKDIILK